MEKVILKTTPEKGRGLYVTETILEGTIIFQEQPLVSCQYSWNAAYGYLACEYCLRPLETAERNAQRLANDPTIMLPRAECCPVESNLVNHAKCEQCGVLYCSSECRSSALERYHAAICLGAEAQNENHPVNVLVDFWKKMHYPPETCGIMLFVKIVGLFRQTVDPQGLQNQLQEFVHKSVNEDLLIFHKMLGEKFTKQIEQLYSLFAVAFNVGSDERLSWLTVDSFKSLIALVGTNGQGIGTSSFGDWVKNVSECAMDEKERTSVDQLIDELYGKMDTFVGSFLNNEGSALYARQSKINHSCSPNAETVFPQSNHVLALRATRDIHPGEEISISYLDECNLQRSRHSRQKILKDYYLFICQCEKCNQEINDPDETSEDEDDEDEDMEDSD
ncbi:histone-lysine N-trimethyltransferase SMYD5 [Anopheles ziemanni]|uniref:histone-lysine N-trimethyltransferase SMYD5 n=1 Tax=Anopheles coustani TaxID=139045 RepID=UPI00265A24B7|nr:histone-lysine N-trimethyltransferase SMYD5 [Anopheles coustani]XP_058175435.1 histone-lysine N-trimethyltransferase SMYD5 [Anopheles ziemanni]